MLRPILRKNIVGKKSTCDIVRGIEMSIALIPTDLARFHELNQFVLDRNWMCQVLVGVLLFNIGKAPQPYEG